MTASEAAGVAATTATPTMTATTAAAASVGAGRHRSRSQSDGSNEEDRFVQFDSLHGCFFPITELTRRVIAPLRVRICSLRTRDVCADTANGQPSDRCPVLAALGSRLRNCAAEGAFGQTATLKNSANSQILNSLIDERGS
jgi:hypothetical protein